MLGAGLSEGGGGEGGAAVDVVVEARRVVARPAEDVDGRTGKTKAWVDETTTAAVTVAITRPRREDMTQMCRDEAGREVSSHDVHEEALRALAGGCMLCRGLLCGWAGLELVV